MVSNEVKFVSVEREFDSDPHLLIQQEQMDVVEERCHVFFAEGVVTATSDYDSGVDREVTHCVAEPRAGGLTTSPEWDEFTLDNFTVDSDWLEVSQLIDQFSITLLATKIINTILNCVTLHRTINLAAK